MAELFEDKDGAIMHREAAGGHGGGSTSFAVRHATDDEKQRFHENRVQLAEAAAAAAQEHLARVRVAHAGHMDTLPKDPAVEEARVEAERVSVLERERRTAELLESQRAREAQRALPEPSPEPEPTHTDAD